MDLRAYRSNEEQREIPIASHDPARPIVWLLIAVLTLAFWAVATYVLLLLL